MSMDTHIQAKNPNTADAAADAPIYADFFRRTLACAVDSILFFVVLWFLSIFVLGGITFESVDRGETDVFIMFIGCLIALFTKKHQAFHDFPAGSIVVRKGTRREIPDATIDDLGRLQSAIYLQNREKPTEGPQVRQNHRDVVEECGFNSIKCSGHKPKR